MQGAGCRLQGAGCKVQGAGLRVEGDQCASAAAVRYSTAICRSEAGSWSRLIDYVYHSTLGLRVIRKKKRICRSRVGMSVCASGSRLQYS